LQGLPQGAQQINHCEPAKGGHNNFPIFVIARLPVREAYRLVIARPPKAGVAISSICHCEASREGSRGNLIFLNLKYFSLKTRLPRLNADAFRLAMTERAKSLRSSQ